ncbi:MAG: DUF1080 domain-containing protein [Planctomycetes bacterium]|nr:DUF1080 domain-containing protein [Planctomycetota bacterium]MBL7043217.1 DUF1080 domain-containing protein [Pirellulaceae bacterium]
MKSRTAFLLLVVFSLCFPSFSFAQHPPAADDDLTKQGFACLFNGKDLTGWEGRSGAWEVKDGAIWCTGKELSRNWLIWRGGELRDFELRLKFKYVKGNSGVQVRSKEIEPFMVRGYQVEVAAKDKMGLWHHSISPAKHRSHLATAGQRVRLAADGSRTVEQVAEPAMVQVRYRQDGWNELIMVGKGTRLTQKINGVVFADLTDEDAEYATSRGLLAFQDHGHGTVVGFKDIWLKRQADGHPSPN